MLLYNLFEKMHLKFGKITEVDEAKGLAKVTFEEDDNLVTRFLPMSMPKTLQDKFIIPYDVNEHVWCIMDEFCEDGVIGGAIYDSNNQPPGGSATGVSMIKFVPNLSLKYERNSKTLSIVGDEHFTLNITGNVTINCKNANVTATEKVTVNATQNIEVESASEIKMTAPVITANGNVTVNGDITASGTITGGQVKEGSIRLGTHKHTGVQAGSSTSGGPTP